MIQLFFKNVRHEEKYGELVSFFKRKETEDVKKRRMLFYLLSFLQDETVRILFESKTKDINDFQEVSPGGITEEEQIIFDFSFSFAGYKEMNGMILEKFEDVLRKEENYRKMMTTIFLLHTEI